MDDGQIPPNQPLVCPKCKTRHEATAPCPTTPPPGDGGGGDGDTVG